MIHLLTLAQEAAAKAAPVAVSAAAATPPAAASQPEGVATIEFTDFQKV